MKNFILVGVLGTLVSGCVPHLLAVAAIPIILPIDAAQTSASITQPVTVESSSGKALASPPLESVPVKARFETTNRTVRCNGRTDNAFNRSNQTLVDLTCSNGMRGEVKISSNLTVGYSFSMEVEGRRSESIACFGNFRGSGRTQGPFLVSCQHLEEIFADFTQTKKERSTVAARQAAVSAGPTASGNYGVTIWVPGK